METEQNKITEYTVELQKLFLEMMVHDAQSYVRVQNIFNPENFDRSLRKAADFIFSTQQFPKSVSTSCRRRAFLVKKVRQRHDVDALIGEKSASTSWR